MVAPRAALLAAFLLALPGAGLAIDTLPLDTKQVRERWHGRLDNRHFSAEVELSLELGGRPERRKMTLWRVDEVAKYKQAPEERLMVRFNAPPDLRNLGLLYFEHDDRPNDYFVYQPETRRVRRLPESLVDDELFGVDLEFLGFGVAQTEPTQVESLVHVILDGERPTYRLVERATRSNARFDRRTTWLDAETFVALRTEHHRGGRRVLLARVKKEGSFDGVVTPIHVSFERDAGTVELHVTRVDYTSPIPEEYFSILALIRTSIQPESD